jgi:hypothetical protein
MFEVIQILYQKHKKFRRLSRNFRLNSLENFLFYIAICLNVYCNMMDELAREATASMERNIPRVQNKWLAFLIELQKTVVFFLMILIGLVFVITIGLTINRYYKNHSSFNLLCDSFFSEIHDIPSPAFDRSSSSLTSLISCSNWRKDGF